MKHRFKIGDTIHYIDINKGNFDSCVNRMPYIAYGGVKRRVPHGRYVLDDGTFVSEPLVYANSEEAGHEHVVKLLRYLQDVSEAYEAVIGKLEDYGFDGGELRIQDEIDVLSDESECIKAQMEHIRSIPEAERTPAMKSLMQMVENPSAKE